MAIRVATAVVGIPLLIAVAVVGGRLFKGVVIVAAIVGAWEAYHMLRGRGHHPALLLGLAMSGLLAASAGVSHPSIVFRATLLVGAIIVFLWFLISARTKQAFEDWVLTIAVSLYVGGLLGSLISVRGLHDGLRLVLLVLVLSWAYDTGAYFAGRAMGRTPFMSWVSPSKTWEGVVGGLALTIVVALIGSGPARIGVPIALVLGVVVAIAAQTGDLAESLLKRYAEVKDSGVIIPGHGGLLDRIDSWFFTGTAAYYVLLLGGYH